MRIRDPRWGHETRTEILLKVLRRVKAWLKSTGLAQWIFLVALKDKNPDSWVYIRKNDWRFARDSKSAIWVNADESLNPKFKKIRYMWKEWLVVKLSDNSPPSFLAVDTEDGERRVCFGKLINPGKKVALRIGGKGFSASFISTHLGREAPKIEFLDRLKSDDLTRAHSALTRL